MTGKRCRATVTRIEGAKNRRIDYDVLEKLAEALRVDTGYVIVHDVRNRRRKDQ